MTQRGTYILTAVATGLYLLLSWAFADGLFSFSNFWNSDEVSSSSLFTYLMVLAIVLAGYRVAQNLPKEAAVEPERVESSPGQISDPVFWRKLLGNVHYALIWLPIRFFVGREWMSAGEHKLRDSAWMDGGTALQGYWNNIVVVPEQGRPSITYGWYREFIQYMLNHEWYSWFGPTIAIGEFLVGTALILGALVGVAAFFGTLMNFNFQLAGSASSNPVLFGLGVFLVLAWKTAGYFGLDRFLLPNLGAPWKPGQLFSGHVQRETVPTT
jgi:thiosulfate dehydrogenase [quinone] large subunit